MLEARHFTIFNDHKPIICAFQQKRDKCSLHQFNHLDFVSQFTTDIRHISVQDNVVADTLSRVESVTAPLSYNALAASQEGDDELRTLLGSTTGLRLENYQSRHYGLHLLQHICRKISTVHSSSPTASCVPVHP
jgi:cleavage and polyadenylation specificity factor subunit 1